MEARSLLAAEIKALVALRRDLMRSCDRMRAEYDSLSLEDKSRCAELLRATDEADAQLAKLIEIAERVYKGN